MLDSNVVIQKGHRGGGAVRRWLGKERNGPGHLAGERMSKPRVQGLCARHSDMRGAGPTVFEFSVPIFFEGRGRRLHSWRWNEHPRSRVGAPGHGKGTTGLDWGRALQGRSRRGAGARAPGPGNQNACPGKKRTIRSRSGLFCNAEGNSGTRLGKSRQEPARYHRARDLADRPVEFQCCCASGIRLTPGVVSE